MRISRTITTALLLASGAVFAADTELTNYKSGISLNFGDSATTATDKGSGYMEEYLYFDKVVSDRKIVYIQDDTAISMSHNSLNVAGDDGGSDALEAVDTSVGQIVYKVDGDQSWMVLDPANWHDYSTPITFAGLNYGLWGASGTAVVGTTGRVGTLSRATKTSTYYRGIAETVGAGTEEWHTITVADDDSARTSNAEYRVSDAKVFLFVVNPKVPAMTWRVTGTGQFYTTPPKKYFIPKIYGMTTYLQAGTSGTVTVEIRDINGGNISYKINGGSTVNVGAANVTLDQDDFSSGSNTLEYWITSTPTVTRTRTVVKDPAFPSASETHGDRFWVDATQWAGIQTNMESAPGGVTPWMDKWETAANSESTTRNGKRNDGSGMENALVARKHGMTRTRAGDSLPNAQFAKRSLFEFIAAVDPCGVETNGSNVPIGSKEWFDRGYTDINARVQAACAYDVLIGYYRTNQGYATGISPIEDYYIRDAFASYIHVATLFMAGYIGPTYDNYDDSGMWETSRSVSAALIAYALPGYSSPYYGTCGLDGNTTTYDDCPFPDEAYTWERLFIKNDITLSANGFPNVDKHVGVDEVGALLVDAGYSQAGVTSTGGDFEKKTGYISTTNLGHVFAIWWNIQKLANPDFDFTKADQTMTKARTGTLWCYGAGGTGYVTNYFAGLQNAWFSAFRTAAQPLMLAESSASNNSWSRQTLQGGPYYVLWYDHDLPLPSAEVGTVETPTFSTAQPGTYETTQSVSLACATAGATIHYRLDGGAWQTYSTALSINETTLVESYATKAAMNDSGVLSGTFTIAVSPVTFAPSAGTYTSTQTVTLATSTSGATILYSIDGSAPSLTYTSALSVGSNLTIRTKATKGGLADSVETSATYQIDIVTPTSDWGESAFAAQTEPMIAEVTVSVAQLASNLVIGLAPATDVDAFTDLACIVRLSSANVFDARDGSAYAADAAIPYVADTEYRIRFVVNFTAHTYDVYVDDVLLADDFAFRTEQASANTLTAFAWRMTNSDYTATLSDFAAYLVTPPVRAVSSPRALIVSP